MTRRARATQRGRGGADDADVGAVDQAQECVTRRRVREPKRHRPLVRVCRQEEDTILAPEGWPPDARVVAVIGVLDLDHLGTEGAEDLGAVRARERGRHVDDAQACERELVHGADLTRTSADTAFTWRRPIASEGWLSVTECSAGELVGVADARGLLGAGSMSSARVSNASPSSNGDPYCGRHPE